MSNNIRELVRDVVASPLGEVIASIGEGVSEAQQALDEAALAKTLEIYAQEGEEAREEIFSLLRDIGYRPTFYALPETTGEVRVALRLGNLATGSNTGVLRKNVSRSRIPAINASLSRIGRNIGTRPKIYATPVDAGYSNQFGYQADISAKLSFKIVPVPAPDGADELRVLPDLVGDSVDSARRRLESLGLEAGFVDSNDNIVSDPAADMVVNEQSPNPAEIRIVRLGDLIELKLSSGGG